MNKKMHLLALLLPVVFVGLMGCGRVVTFLSSSYFPHQDGYQWVYKGTMVIGTAEPSVIKKTVRFDGTTTLSNGLTVQNMVVSEEAGAFAIKAFAAPASYYYVDENGVYTYGSSSNPTTEGTLIISLPLEVGKKWNRGELFSCEAVAIEDVTVPAGTFRAIKVQLGDSNFCEWYAENVGRVKTFIDNLPFTTLTGETVVGSYSEELVSKNF